MDYPYAAPLGGAPWGQACGCSSMPGMSGKSGWDAPAGKPYPAGKVPMMEGAPGWPPSAGKGMPGWMPQGGKAPMGWTPPAVPPAPQWSAPSGKTPPGRTSSPGMIPPGWTAPAGKSPMHHPYGPSAEYGEPGEPAALELMALIEPALNSVLPAILGLLQISGMLLAPSPMGPDMPGPEPTELTPGEPSPLSFGLGHLGLFGPPGSPEVPGSHEPGPSTSEA